MKNKKTWGLIIVLIVLLTALVLFSNGCFARADGNESKSTTMLIVDDNFRYKKANAFFYNEVAIKVGKLIIPARTPLKVSCLSFNEWGIYNNITVSLSSKDTVYNFSFTRKELVERPKKVLVKNKKGKMIPRKILAEPKNLILNNIEIDYKGYKLMEIARIDSAGKHEFCNLLFQP